LCDEKLDFQLKMQNLSFSEVERESKADCSVQKFLKNARELFPQPNFDLGPNLRI